ncbi:MAG: HAMP domain-containing histidine kinase [Clostridia bacterium]|nr:HAMP domain-containing histidine kinase [Clostridia bacterium]
MLKIFTNLLKKDWAIHITVTIISFFVLFTSSGSTMLVIILIRNIFPDFFIQLAPVTLTFIAFISSTIIGTGTSLFVSRYFFKPVDAVIKSQKKVANGDFSAKVTAPKGDTIITDLVNGFNTMTDELGSTEMFRNDFINNFSHEFKTPIVSIRGFAKQLQNDDLSEEQRREYIDIIVNESDRLASMSSNILLLTKFENQQMVTDKTEFYLDEQIRKCILLLEKDWAKKNIEFDIDLNEIRYYSNEEMLSHVWLNILNNAIKFTPEKGTVTVKCYHDSSNITVKIIDNGIGMDDKTQRHIFDKFYQGDASHTSIGNGLGLPLAKRVVTLCGGKISVKSQMGKGTTFIVRLPIESDNDI